MRYADLIRVAESMDTTPDPELQRKQQALERLRELNRQRIAGMAVSWFQSIKSGMPSVDWILVLSGSEASSLRNIAIA